MQYPQDFEAMGNPARLKQKDIQSLVDLALEAKEDCITSTGNTIVITVLGHIIVATEYVIAKLPTAEG